MTRKILIMTSVLTLFLFLSILPGASPALANDSLERPAPAKAEEKSGEKKSEEAVAGEEADEDEGKDEEEKNPIYEYKKKFWEEVEIDKENAAEIKNVVFQKDRVKITFEKGLLYLQKPINDIVLQGLYLGSGKIEYAPPTYEEDRGMERQQLKRFAGVEELSYESKSASISFPDARDEKFFRSFEQNVTVVADSPEHEAIEKYIKRIKKAFGSNSFRNAWFSGYLRELYGDDEPFEFDIGAEGVEGSPAEVLYFEYDPNEEKEVTIAGVNEKAQGWRGSLWNNFHKLEDYRDPNFRIYYLEGEKKEEYDILSYLIDATIIGSGRKNFEAETVVDVRSLRDNLRLFTFALDARLLFSELHLDDGTKLHFHREKSNFRDVESGIIHVLLPEPVNKGEEFRFRVSYAGDLLEPIGLGTFAVKDNDRWYPTWGNPHNKATFDVTLRAPEGNVISCAGKKVKEWKEGGNIVGHWVLDEPQDLIAFNVGDFVSHTVTTRSGMPITAYSDRYGIKGLYGIEVGGEQIQYEGTYIKRLSATSAKMAEPVAQEICNCVELYTELYGKLPFSKLDATSHPWSHGRGATTVLLLWDWAFYSETAANFLEVENHLPPGTLDIHAFRAHETAHQWWGHVVNFKTLTDNFLSEAMAEYSSYMYVEKRFSPERMFAKLDKTWGLLHPDGWDWEKYVPIALWWRGSSVENECPKWHHQALLYNKGAYVIHMLRMMVRFLGGTDDDFFDILREFQKKFYCQDASVMDFKDTFEKHFRRNLDWFWNQWLFSTGIPEINFSYDLKKSSGKYKISGDLNQVNTDFDFIMGIYIHGKKEDELARIPLIVMDKNFHFEKEIELPFQPRKVSLNDWREVFCRINYK